VALLACVTASAAGFGVAVSSVSGRRTVAAQRPRFSAQRLGSVAPPAMAAAAANIELPPAPTPNFIFKWFTGIYFTIACTISVFIVYPPLLVLTTASLALDNTRRSCADWIVQLWARLTLMFLFSGVTVEGVGNLPGPKEAVLYVPNHCSFLDIFSLSGFLPRRFKYVSKIEILRIPLIGWAMRMAKHIAIRRSDRASQLATFKEAVACLEAGSSLVTFPEGTRSKDGRIMAFKKGPFTMAQRAGVRVVPISIIGTHLYHPPNAMLPISRPKGIRIVIHPPLPPPEAKKEDATMKLAKAAIESALPPSMLPLPASE